ncbi:MAG TPA: MBL fold metallo-hydrolase [Steroidobacteraceae bacterium]|nr:MBL fold metallo-hydrolase [Steroidobacteraceae bacterium]
MRTSRWLVGGVATLLCGPVALAQVYLDMRWDPGADDCAPGQQRTEQHAIDAGTIAIRQSPCVDYEAPLMYLLLGEQRALLIDSGVSGEPAATRELTGIVSAHLLKPDGSRLPLVVAHTHGHQDHRAGDAAFAALPNTTVVPHDGEAMRKFFGFRQWPDDEIRFELGGREIVLLPTPGHHPDHVAFLDARTRLLFTGDFYLPGRLLVEDIDAYRDSAMRLVEFVQTWGVEHALGAHIEMNASGEMYSNGATFHPEEHPMDLPLGLAQAVELHGALQEFNGFYNRHGSYAISNPVHNLIALGAGAIIALVLLVLGARRFRKNRRA